MSLNRCHRSSYPRSRPTKKPTAKPAQRPTPRIRGRYQTTLATRPTRLLPGRPCLDGRLGVNFAIASMALRCCENVDIGKSTWIERQSENSHHLTLLVRAFSSVFEGKTPSVPTCTIMANTSAVPKDQSISDPGIVWL